MSGSEDRPVTGSRQASRFYRRRPGIGWLLAVAAIPLLLALIGQGMAERSNLAPSAPGVSSVAAPTLPVSSVNRPGVSFAPLAILRNGNVITLNGDVPDIVMRTGLLDMLTRLYGSDVQLVDNLNIKPGVATPDFAALGSVFNAAVSMPDFKFKIDGGTVTLMGTAASEAVKSAVSAAAKTAWPNFTLSNNILVLPDAPQAPTSLAPSAFPAPAHTPGGDCGNLQADITALLSTPVTFGTNGKTLNADSRRQLSRVAEKLTGCHNARVVVSGYTDNTGNDGINVPLSAGRAKAVADFLVAQGVPAHRVTAKGFGSADAVAGNATPEGRAQNRRVEITVG